MSNPNDIILPSEEEVKKFGGPDPNAEGTPETPALREVEGSQVEGPSRDADAPADADRPGPAEGPPPEEDPLAGKSEDEVRRLAADALRYKETAQRAVADLANFRKRAARDRRRQDALARRDVLRAVVQTLDDLDKALEAARAAASDPEAAVAAVVEGVGLTREGLSAQLAALGFRPMNALGARFDPQWHEAVDSRETDEAPPGTVIERLQEGYLLDDLVIRTARVVVSRAPPDEAGEPGGAEPKGKSEAP